MTNTRTNLTELRKKVFLDRYALRNSEGAPIESAPENMWRRVALALAGFESTKYGYDGKQCYELFYNVLKDYRFVPGGRILSGLGSGATVTYFNCYVLPSPEDSRVGILDTLKLMTEIMARGGGVGVNMSSIRPKDFAVKSVNGKATGPVSWGQLYSVATGDVINQGGSRRGALMLLLDDNHPDIFAFIDAKKNSNWLQYANISVAVSDGFMDAVANNLTWDLKWNGQVVQTVKARDIWKAIGEAAWTSGDPGVVFMERYNKQSNLPREVINAINPCWTGDTKVWTINGPRTFLELASTGNDVQVLSQDDTGHLVFKWMRHPRRTREQSSIVEITLDDNTVLHCTPDHQLFLCTGEIVSVQDLRVGAALGSVYRHKANTKGYMSLFANGISRLEHHVVADATWANIDYSCNQIHHIDENKANNVPSNLAVVNSHKHGSSHKLGARNPMSGVWDSRNTLFGRSVAGTKNPRYRHDVSDNAILELRRNGNSHLQIAKTLGCSEALVQKRLKQLEIPINHRVVAINHNVTARDVYNGTVDDTHRFFVVCEKGAILSKNCGEEGLPPFGVCNLGSINLMAFYNEDGTYDWDGLGQAVEIGVRILDDTLTMNDYFLAENKEAVLRSRRIGIGTMGLADLLFKMKLRYGSPEASVFITKIYALIRDVAYDASSNLAKIRGPFVDFESSEFLSRPFVDGLSSVIKKKIWANGIRNGTLLTQAPTGTTSILAGVSSGIEPVFQLITNRDDRLGEHRIVNPIWQEWCDENNVDPMDTSKAPDYFVTASDITPEEHVLTQALIQEYVDASISKTVNLPTSATPEDILNIYQMAYDQGCKGITVFRDGCKKGVLSDGSKVIEKPASTKRELGALPGLTYKIRYPYQGNPANLYVTVNGIDKPTEVFIAGEGAETELNALGRTISQALQNGTLVEKLIKSYWQVKGSGAVFGNPGCNRVITCAPNAIAFALQQFITKDISVDSSPEAIPGALICSVCGYPTLILEEGCQKCYHCGDSKCG